jgi:hypothetical protein
MSNGLSGCTQYVFNAKSDRIERTRQAERLAFEHYVISYMDCITTKTCKCAACKNIAIKLVKAVMTESGVDETWKCGHCERIVNRSVSNEEFSQWLNEDRQKTA